MTDPHQDPAPFAGIMRALGRERDADRAWQLCPVERAAILRCCWRQLLVMTPAGRRRLRRWLDHHRAHQPSHLSRDERVRHVAQHLRLFGEPGLQSALVRAVAALPRPVSDAVVDEAAILVVGRTTNGWIAGPISGALILLDGRQEDDAIAATLKHEAGHLWSQDWREPYTARDLFDAQETMIAACGNRALASRVLDGQVIHAERVACALAASWTHQ